MFSFITLQKTFLIIIYSLSCSKLVWLSSSIERFQALKTTWNIINVSLKSHKQFLSNFMSHDRLMKGTNQNLVVRITIIALQVSTRKKHCSRIESVNWTCESDRNHEPAPFLWTGSSDSLNRFIHDLVIITSPLLTQLLCCLVFSLFCSLNKSWLQKTGLLTLWAEMSEVSILRHETLQLERGNLSFVSKCSK